MFFLIYNYITLSAMKKTLHYINFTINNFSSVYDINEFNKRNIEIK